MRKILYCLLLLVAMSCEDAGSSYIRLNGSESKLPPELKGLKVYSVAIEDGGYVRVAILNNQINSLNYIAGKQNCSTIILNNNARTNNIRTIYAKEILSETDSIIVIQK